MKVKKLLAVSVAAAMVLGTMTLPAFANEEIGGNARGELVLAAGTVLPEAVDGVVTLTEDVILAETAAFSEGEVTIDLAGFTLTTPEAADNNSWDAPNQSVLSLSGTAKVTVIDSSSGKTGKIIAGTVTNCRGTSSSTINMDGGGTLVIDGAAVQGAKTINCREGGMAIKSDHRNRPEIQMDIQIINGAKIIGGEDCTDLGVSYEYGSDDNTYGATAIYTKTNGTITIADSEVIGGKGVGPGRKGGRGIEMDAFSYDGYPWDEEYTNMVCGTLNISGSVIRGGDSQESNASGVALMTASQGVISDSQIYGGNAPGIGGAAVYVGSIAPTSEFVRCTIAGGNGTNSWAGNAVEIYTAGGFKATDCTIAAGKGVNNGSTYGSAIWYYEETKKPTVLENCELIVQPENQVAAIGGTARGQSEITVEGSLKIKSEGEETKGSDLKSESVKITWTEKPKILYANADGTEYKEAVVFIDGAGYLSIAEALEAAKAGDVIEILPGTYEGDVTIHKGVTLKGTEGTVLNGAVVANADNVTIEGITFAGYGNPTLDAAPYSVCVTQGKSGVSIKNCVFAAGENKEKVKGITAETGVENLVVDGNTFNENYETAVYLNNGATGAKLLNNKVNTTGFGFRLAAAQNAQISGNIFDVKGLWDHAALEFRSNGSDANTGITVEGNSFEGKSNIDFYDQGAFGEEKLNLSENYWGGGMPGSAQLGNAANGITVNSYYTALDESTGLPEEDSLVTIVEEPEEVTKHIELEAVEGTNQVNVYITGSLADGTAAYVKNLIAAHINLTVTDGFVITDVTAADQDWCVDVVGEHDYLVRAKGRESTRPGAVTAPEAKVLSGDKIHIATVTIGGYGTGTLTAAGGEDTENDVEQKTDEDNIVISGNLDQTALDFNFSPATQNLTLRIAFPNAVENQAKAYQDMKVSISGGNLTEAITYDLGKDCEGCTFGTVALNGKNYDGYTIEAADTLLQNTAYTVTIEGAGYRTVRYTVNMQEADKELTFWNNVMDADTVIEKDNVASTAKVTYLAGDIVKDNSINIYDLSAVVSYFGTVNDVTAESDYAKYDLNRDGKIDSKDVAMVLVSWGN